eukprot:10504516-Ditylum_brightwellii.AAC.1
MMLMPWIYKCYLLCVWISGYLGLHLSRKGGSSTVVCICSKGSTGSNCSTEVACIHVKIGCYINIPRKGGGGDKASLSLIAATVPSKENQQQQSSNQIKSNQTT